MKLIITAISKAEDAAARLVSEWQQRGCAVDLIRLDHLTTTLRNSKSLAVDAIVLISSGAHVFLLDEDRDSLTTSLEVAFNTEAEVQSLDDHCAMLDGRKWKSVPVILLWMGRWDDELWASALAKRLNVVSHNGDESAALRAVRQFVTDYRRRLLDELDNLGFLVSYEAGRFKIGPALSPTARAEGDFYFGPTDKRDLTTKCYTVDRDNYGIQVEVDEFEALINTADVSEYELQKFFESHPHFLVTPQLMEPLSQVQLRDSKGKLLIPDFIMRPVVAVHRDSRWQVLDLKRPQAQLLAGKGSHTRLSQEVMKAINQLRDYGDYFADPSNSERVAAVLRHPVRRPKLAVLIGRLPKPSDVEALETAQTREPDVQIVTYDEILETQLSLL